MSTVRTTFEGFNFKLFRKKGLSVSYVRLRGLMSCSSCLPIHGPVSGEGGPNLHIWEPSGTVVSRTTRVGTEGL